MIRNLIRKVNQSESLVAFTLSEVLITIAIIGVVAAIVLPSVINNIRDMEYATARKFVLKNLGGAGRLMAVNGTIRDAANAQDFVENYLSKQLKIIKTCTNDKLKECGIMTDENGILSVAESRMTMPTDITQLSPEMARDTKLETMKNKDKSSYGFVMANGYSINLFYNPYCLSDITNVFSQNIVCMNAIYDINGLAKPNQVGKDIGFVTVIYPDVKSVAVAPDFARVHASKANFNNASQKCTEYGNNVQKGYNSVPDLNELIALSYNSVLYNVYLHYYLLSSSKEGDSCLGMYTGEGSIIKKSCDSASLLRCIRR